MNRTLYFLIVCVLIGGHLVSFAMEERKSLVAYNGQQGQVVQGLAKNVMNVDRGANLVRPSSEETGYAKRPIEVGAEEGEEELPEGEILSLAPRDSKERVELLEKQLEEYRSNCDSLKNVFSLSYGSNNLKELVPSICKDFEEKTGVVSALLKEKSFGLYGDCGSEKANYEIFIEALTKYIDRQHLSKLVLFYLELFPGGLVDVNPIKIQIGELNDGSTSAKEFFEYVMNKLLKRLELEKNRSSKLLDSQDYKPIGS